MNILDYVAKAARALERAGLDYALVGGLACVLMGVRRTTEDADFIVKVESAADAERLIGELRREGLDVVEREVFGALADRGHFTIIVGEWRLDFKFASSALDLETLGRAVEVEVAGARVRVAPLEENIAAKLLVLRSLKDVEDALWLMVQHRDAIDWERLGLLLGSEPRQLVKRILAEIKGEFHGDAAVESKLRELERRLEELGRPRKGRGGGK